MSVLLRNFIYECLYSPKRGYFHPVKEADLPLRRTSLGGQDAEQKFASAAHWEAHVRDLYHSAPRTWLTPSELFSPYYGRAIGRFLSLLHQHDTIVEVGAGNGTAALDALNYLREVAPEQYARTVYHTVEISAPFVMRQREQLFEHVEAGRCFVHHCSALEMPMDISVPNGMETSARPGVNDGSASDRNGDHGQVAVVALEVLDNLAHDAVAQHRRTGDWYQVLIDAEGRFSYELLQDEYILDACRVWGLGPYHEAEESPGAPESIHEEAATFASGVHPLARSVTFLRDLFHRLNEAVLPSSAGNAPASDADMPSPDDISWPIYVPTDATCLLRNLSRSFPRGHSLFVADFSTFSDSLPTASGTSIAPVIQTFGHGSTVNWPSVRPGEHDIMFSTSFPRLQRAHRRACGSVVAQELLSQQAWWRKYAATNPAGYNPILESFANVSIYFGRALFHPRLADQGKANADGNGR